MIGGKMAEAVGSDQIKSCFAFTVADNSGHGQNVRPFRDPIGLGIFVKVANQLRADGFHVTEAKHGKACDAAFEVQFPKFDVLAIMSAERREEGVDCGVLTWCIRPLWRRVSPQVVAEGWIRACAAIERVLRQELRISPLLWLTRNQAEAHWKKNEEMVSSSPHNDRP